FGCFCSVGSGTPGWRRLQVWGRVEVVIPSIGPLDTVGAANLLGPRHCVAGSRSRWRRRPSAPRGYGDRDRCRAASTAPTAEPGERPEPGAKQWLHHLHHRQLYLVTVSVRLGQPWRGNFWPKCFGWGNRFGVFWNFCFGWGNRTVRLGQPYGSAGATVRFGWGNRVLDFR